MTMDRKKLAVIVAVAAVLVVLIAVIVNMRRPSPPPPDIGMPDSSAARTPPTEQEVASVKQAGTIRATIESSKGKIELDLQADLMPVTVANFVKLAENGFYDGLKFHRVEDWVIQGGDPLGTGTGGPGYTIKLETSPQLKNVRGALAMARKSDPDSAGSQFYILREDASWLDGQYAVFGKVTSGLDVVDEIRVGDQMTKVTIVK
jgi:peptidyl-prolyl cis-trans isomerase B (cyclophilin B)